MISQVDLLLVLWFGVLLAAVALPETAALHARRGRPSKGTPSAPAPQPAATAASATQAPPPGAITEAKEPSMMPDNGHDHLLLLDLWRCGVGFDGLYRLIGLRAAVRGRGILAADGLRTDLLPLPQLSEATTNRSRGRQPQQPAIHAA